MKKLVLSKRSGSLIRRITILSFIAISLSLSAFFIVLFVMNGMNRNIKSRIISLEPHLVTYNKVEKDKDIFSSVPKDAALLQFESFDLILRTMDGTFKGSEAVGYSTDGLFRWQKQLLELRQNQGRFSIFPELENDKWELLENEVAIGVDLARSLGLFEGDELTLIPPETLLLSSLETPLFQKVIVKRILVTDLNDLDAKLILFNTDLSLRNFSRTLSHKRGYHIWLDSVDKALGIKKDLLQKSLQAETWQERNSDLFFSLKMEKIMIGSFLGLAGLIASSSILTVLALLMSQKKRDIAVIKTMGLSQRKTLWLFTKMGLWISCSAIFLGGCIGVGVSYYIEKNPVHILPNIYYDSSIPAMVDPIFVLVVLFISFLLAFLGSYFPAKITLTIQPAILLRQRN